MASNGFKINKSANFNPQNSAPDNPTDGDFYFDSSLESFVYYHGGAWANLDSVGSVAQATNLTSTQFTPSVVQNAVVKVTGTGASTLHGLSASHTGKRLFLYNYTDSTITLKYESGTELTADNRIVTPTAGDMNLVAGEIVEFIYDVVATRWLLVSIGSGAGAQLPATTTSNGIVQLNATPLTPSAPTVVTISTGGGASVTASSGNTNGLTGTSSGSGAGVRGNGDPAAVGTGTQSNAVSGIATGAGRGGSFIGGDQDGIGVNAQGGGTNGKGGQLVGKGTGAGLRTLSQGGGSAIECDGGDVTFTTAGRIKGMLDPNAAQDASTANITAITPGGRLTLTTATPVTTTDVTGATTVYYTPYMNNVVVIYDGTGWVPTAFSELSQLTTDATKSPAAVANNSNYDIFVWSDSGTLRATRGPAWSSDTARGTGAGTTELELFQGRYVNKVAITNGPAARYGLYVGTIRSDGSAQINDSLAKRHVWNMHNRILRTMRRFETTTTWTYSTGTIRQANGASANQLDLVCGLAEDEVRANVSAQIAANASGGLQAGVAVGLDSTTTPATDSICGVVTVGVSAYVRLEAQFSTQGLLGRHTLVWLENSSSANNTFASNGTVVSGVPCWSGIIGTMRG